MAGDQNAMTGLRLRPAHGRGRPVPLDADPITIGRHPDNRIRLRDDRVSRFHCIIEPSREGGFVVRDLESRNGVRVNGEHTRFSPLVEGDTLRVGKSEFVIEAAAGSVGGSVGMAAREGSEDSAPWAAELQRILRELPPRNAPPEQFEIINADGKTSEVMSGTGEGVRAVKQLLRVASKSRATDIHIEPKGEHVQVRMRVDGQMVWIADLPNRVGELVIGLVKSATMMKQAARDAVLDGHFSTRFTDRRVEYRVSLTPSVQGQKAVVRVLDNRDAPHAIEELGMLPYMHERLRLVTRKDSGLLLVCGPTGSGKTTTLYAALKEIDRDAKNVVTIEDPVEYTIDGVTQLPVDEDKGKGFSELLRSVLRQDPDIILVGEIRDEPTARTAMQAAITGHLVFSTVHAKDSVSSIFRLLDLKVEPYLVANSLDVVLAQRLVRTLCEHCKRLVPVSPGQATRMGKHLGGRSEVYDPVGCGRCLGTGFRGRRALFELLDVNDDLRDIILGEPSIGAMRRVIDAGLFTTLAQYGWRLAAEGFTSLDEIDAVAGA
ncbi:MAG: ATPase, T2SS/T4P/T4SS family [Phycisphaerales bacterium JB037]